MTTAEGSTVTSVVQQPSLNPVSPEALLNPVPFYKALRENAPVHWSPELHSWIVTRHEDVTACFRDSRMSPNRMKFFENQFQGLPREEIQEFLQTFSHFMIMKEGRDHLRVRRGVNPGFSPQALDSWRPVIHRTMSQLLDKVQHQGQMDLAKEISHTLPSLVIAEILGVDPEDRANFQQWSWDIVEVTISPPDAMGTVAPKANKAIKHFSSYMRDLIQERRQNPGQDVISQMIHAQEGGSMSEEELVANITLLLQAGFLTTTDQLSNGVHDLLTHPDQFQKLKEDTRLLPQAVDEMIRFTSAVPFTFRIVAEPMTLRGQELKQGDVVFLGMASANRDPEAFTDPDHFDITREATRHKLMSFGFGPHHCLGAGLARRELEIAIALLLERMPDLRLDEERKPQLKCNLLFRGFESLPVRW